MNLRLTHRSELRPGDVLLCYGGGGADSVSYWARLFDGGDYSHAAYWDGEQVIEAVGEGVRPRSFETHVGEYEYVHVYRFEKDGHGLGEPGWEPEPIHERARSFLGQGYATSRLATIALLVGTGRKIGLPKLEQFMRSMLGGELKGELEAWERSGRRPMVCSELVASAFYEATPDHRFGLRVELEPTPFTDDVRATDSEAAALQARCARLFAPVNTAPVAPGEGAPAARAREEDDSRPSEPDANAPQPMARLLGVKPRVYDTGSQILTSRVTPRDLARSPTLRRVSLSG